jgi:hypothetical protein
MKIDNIKLRPPLNDDVQFIVCSWLKSNRNSDLTNYVNNEDYYKNHPKIIEDLINRSLITMAVDPEDDNHIYGYVVHENTGSKFIIHYIYVKYTYRNFGIAKKMLTAINPNFGSSETYLSSIDRVSISTKGKRSSCFIKKRDKYKLMYSPYLLAQ